MTIEFGPSIIVTLTADSATPAELVQYQGIRLIWPESRAMPPIGRPDTLVVQGVSVPGYLTDNGQGGRNWVMTAAVDPIVQALNAIPGADGWASDAAKAVYSNVGAALLGHGFQLGEARDGLIQLYQATVANYVAAHP